MRNIIFFHANCTDGFCCAWLCHKCLQPLDEPNEYVPINYGNEVKLDNLKGNNVYILDFSFKPDVLQSVIDTANHTVLLDHHKTAQKDLLPFTGDELNKKLHIVFDMNKSGGRLTLEYFKQIRPNWVNEKNWLVDYTEDRDLWLWKLDNSREFSAALMSYPKNFQTWNNIYCGSVGSLIREGIAILRYQKQLIEQAVANARTIQLPDGLEIVGVNSCLLQSEIGEELSKLHDCGAIYYDSKDGKRRYSLRSVGDIDVSAIAKQYGGGGHKNSSGFEVQL